MATETIQTLLDGSVETGSCIHTDGWKPFLGVEGYGHERFVPDDPYEGGKDLPRIHLVFSNLKRVIKGTCGHCSPAKLQAYLDLFACRFDHRDDLERAFN